VSRQKYVLVPVEPTPEMLVAINWPNAPAGYRAMLAAAPQAPVAPAVQGEPAEQVVPSGTVDEEFTTGDTYPAGDCDMFEAGIHHKQASGDQWQQRIVVYGDTPADAEALRDRVFASLTAVAPQAEQNPEFGAPYQGAYEEMTIWKRRALEAEQRIRERDQIIDRLGEALNAENGPTSMGEPAPAVQGEPVAEVSQETFSSDGTSDIITCNLPIGTKLYTAPQPPAAPDVAGLESALKSMVSGYIRLLQSGYDRITDLGGDCDPVDVMERRDTCLRDARAALAAHQKQE